MAGTRYCQVVVTASGKLKDQGAKVWVIIHKTITHLKAHRASAIFCRNSKAVELQWSSKPISDKHNKFTGGL